MARREKRNKSRGSAGNNRKLAEDFLIKNRNKPGVEETDTGLQYIIIEEGTGDHPAENSWVELHQRCQLLNGTVIEDTYKKNETSSAQMEELIEGYKEGLMMMKKGSRYKLFIPSELAWGKRGSGTKIPPNALLIFDVRLIDFW
jgi:FKBP-type peptidyl-prolyl cis-trans isomerase